MTTSADIAVSAGDDWLSGLIERRARLFIMLGNLESRMMAAPLAAKPIDRPIYIAGLARAGTTILLELLAAHPDVATHRYRDFPLLFAPLSWNWFLDRASRGDGEPMERAHKDRIRVTRDSPEAMEEMLWMRFFPACHDPRVSSVLGRTVDRPDFEAFYRRHIQKILLLRNRTRYVAKGNYNLTRVGYLHRLFPDARFVVPVRDPVGHVASLMKQHRLFRRLETEDPRALNYMRRAGHFEFGLDRRPINIGDASAADEVQRLWQEGEEIRGWSRYWASLYAHVADSLEADARLQEATAVVHYGDLCEAPLTMLRNLYVHCALQVGEDELRSQAARLSRPWYYQPPFSDAERAIIDDETAAVHARIRQMCRAPTALRQFAR